MANGADGKYFYHYDGTPLAYLHDDQFIISFSGKYLGWVYGSWIVDFSDGSYAFFRQALQEECQGLVGNPDRQGVLV